MTLERTRIEPVHKPWGRNNLTPWYERRRDGIPIGELWFQRADDTARDSALLLKLLFADAPLSIQVHPDDTFARSIGLPNGKTEAWHILAAEPDARVALGLRTFLTAPQLRSAIQDGSIADMVQWHPVAQGDTLLVPAGTVHAIGAGLVIAEVQQNSDATFRLFDYGRGRPLDVENAVAVANARPADRQAPSVDLTDARTLLVSTDSFAMERIALPAHSTWHCDARHETWLLVLTGSVDIGDLDVSTGDAVFLEDERATVVVGPTGVQCLLAYVGGQPSPALVRGRDANSASLPHQRSLEAFT